MKFQDFSILPASYRAMSSWKLHSSIALFCLMDYPFLLRMGQRILPGMVYIPGIRSLIKSTIFRQFCGGETLAEVKKTVDFLSTYNIRAIADYSAEQADTREKQDLTKANVLASIAFAKTQKNVPFACIKITGICARPLLEKISRQENLNPKEIEDKKAFEQRLEELCQATYDAGIKIFIDAEETWINPAIHRITEKMMEKFNREKTVVYTTIQMYTTGGISYIESLLSQTHYHVGIKLVRGAYHEKENAKALREGYPSPILPNKAATDEAYNQGMRLCLQHAEKISFCAATHNVESIIQLTEAIEEQGISPSTEDFSFSQLFGMRDNLTYALAKYGYNVSKYIPYGPLQETIPYLLRRASENAGINDQMGEELKWLLQEKKERKNRK